MTADELIQLGFHKVRNDSHLMKIYIKHFKAKFGYQPNCAGCSFSDDWRKFANTNHSNILIKPMEKTFTLRDNLAIYSYKKTLENGTQVNVRTYGHSMTEEFARAYLTKGTEEQIAARKAQFKVLPVLDEETETDELAGKTLKELKDYAVEMGYPREDWENLKKNDLLAYLTANSN